MIIVIMCLEYECIIVYFIDPIIPHQLVRQSRGTYDMDSGEFRMKKFHKVFFIVIILTIAKIFGFYIFNYTSRLVCLCTKEILARLNSHENT